MKINRKIIERLKLIDSKFQRVLVMKSSANFTAIFTVLLVVVVVIIALDNSIVQGMEFVGEPKHLEVVQGEDVQLECKMDELVDDPHLYWMRGSNVYATSSQSFYPRKEVRKTGSTFYMVIREVKVEDGGEYMCQVPVQGGTALTYVQHLVVNVPPSIEPFDQLTVEVDESSPLDLLCEAHGKPRPIVSWSKLNKNSAKEELLSDSEKLFVESVSPGHAGVYECRADNLVGSPAVQTVKVVVHHKPRCWSPSNQVTTGPGYPATLECLCSSHSHVLVTWYHKDEPIKYAGRPNLLRRDDTSSEDDQYKSILRIKDTKETDLGQYTCVGANRMGTANHSILLSAIPSSVKILSLRTKNKYSDRYALEWTTTSFVKINSFTVTIHLIEGRNSRLLTNMTIQPRNQQLPQKSNQNPHGSLMASHYQSDFIIGLPASSNFSIRMRATNSFGSSSWSDVGYFQTLNSSGLTTQGLSLAMMIAMFLCSKVLL